MIDFDNGFIPNFIYWVSHVGLKQFTVFWNHNDSSDILTRKNNPRKQLLEFRGNMTLKLQVNKQNIRLLEQSSCKLDLEFAVTWDMKVVWVLCFISSWKERKLFLQFTEFNYSSISVVVHISAKKNVLSDCCFYH